MFITPSWFWLAVWIETISLTGSNFCFHLHLFIAPLWFWFAVWIETVSVTGFDRSPYFHKHSFFHLFGDNLIAIPSDRCNIRRLP